MTTRGDSDGVVARGRSSLQRSATAPALSGSRGGLSWTAVERILRHYVELTACEGARASSYDPDRSDTTRRGAHAESLWCCTVGAKLRSDPHRLRPRQWRIDLDLLLFGPRGNRGLQAAMPAADFDELLGLVLKPRVDATISLPELWARVDAELDYRQNAHSTVERLNRRGRGCVAEIAKEFRATYDGWLQLSLFLRGHYAYARSMEYLGHAYRRCMEDDPSFAAELGV